MPAAECGTSLDGESAHVRVVKDARHQRSVDDDSHRRVRHKALQAVSSAAYRHPQPVAYRLLHGVHYLRSFAGEAHIVGLACEALVETPAHKVGVPQVIRSNLLGGNTWIMKSLKGLSLLNGIDYHLKEHLWVISCSEASMSPGLRLMLW